MHPRRMRMNGIDARDQQRLTLGGREMEKLREQRTDCATRHNDRAFGSEWPSSTDRDG